MLLKKISKQFFLTVIAFALLASVMAISKSSNIAIAEGAPNTMKEFKIGGFVNYYDTNITSYADQTRDLARSGLNWIDTPLWVASQMHNRGDEASEAFDWAGFNELCRELGIYFSVQHSDIETAVSYADGLDRAIGYYLKDEPSAAQIPMVAQSFKRYLELDSSRFVYVNMYPNYAGSSNLGGTYEDYVRNWVSSVGAENLEYLYFDHYPFTQYEDVRASYFSDVETIRKVAYENGKLKTGGYTQMGWWNGMREPSIEEARWSMNSLLSYGMKSISHFTWVATPYTAPPEGEGMRDFVLRSDGTRTKLYEPMQKLNWQTRQLGPLLMNIDVAHAYHTGEVPKGTEQLPKNFPIQPSSASDQLMVSLSYAKDSDDIYIMLFNKELTGSKLFNFNVDPTSNIDSLTYFKPDSFDVLPGINAVLAAPEEEEIALDGNNFSVELNAGEMRLYKLNGDVEIKEPLKPAIISHKSGNYIGQQLINIFAPDKDAEIFYTLDGSYPTFKSQRYTKPILIGKDGELSFHTIRAITVRGGEITEAVTSDISVSNSSINAALGKAVTFTGETKAFNGTTMPQSITDGAFDPFNTWGTPNNSPAFAIVDFGKIYPINRVTVKAWHDWTFNDVIVQLSETADFANPYTVYNNDHDNSVGAGIGTDGAYTETPVGHTFEFDTVSARYIRFHNISANDSRVSAWEEIQAYTLYEEGLDISKDVSKWQITGGGTWTNDDGVISQTAGYNTYSWDRSYTYTAKKYKNFILDGTFTFNISNYDAWGYAGFGLYKQNIHDVQSNYDKGIYAAIEPRGRAILWNGAKPELGPDDANIAGFALGGAFNLRIVAINGNISISVNNMPIMSVRDDRLDRSAGYISIHGGLIPVSVSDVRIIELDDNPGFISSEQNVVSFAETRLAVEMFTKQSEVVFLLPQKVSMVDTFGKTHSLDVIWEAASYNMAQTGWHKFIGKTVLPEGVVNKSKISAQADIFVRPYVDKSDLIALVETANSLSPENFTPESWQQMIIKKNAADALLNDPFMVQNDIGVGVFQLYDELYKFIISTVDKTDLQSAMDAASAIDWSKAVVASKSSVEQALSNAQGVYSSRIATPREVADAALKIRTAIADISYLPTLDKVQQLPQLSKSSNVISSSTMATLGGVMAVAGGVITAIALKPNKKKEEEN